MVQSVDALAELVEAYEVESQVIENDLEVFAGLLAEQGFASIN